MNTVGYFEIQADDLTKARQFYEGLLPRPAKIPAAEKVMAHGGIVAMDKFAVVGKCWQGYFQDGQGNTFGIFEVDANAK